jgi:hypothetical protein
MVSSNQLPQSAEFFPLLAHRIDRITPERFTNLIAISNTKRVVDTGNKFLIKS